MQETPILFTKFIINLILNMYVVVGCHSEFQITAGRNDDTWAFYYVSSNQVYLLNLYKKFNFIMNLVLKTKVTTFTN